MTHISRNTSLLANVKWRVWDIHVYRFKIYILSTAIIADKRLISWNYIETSRQLATIMCSHRLLIHIRTYVPRYRQHFPAYSHYQHPYVKLIRSFRFPSTFQPVIILRCQLYKCASVSRWRFNSLGRIWIPLSKFVQQVAEYFGTEALQEISSSEKEEKNIRPSF